MCIANSATRATGEIISVVKGAFREFTGESRLFATWQLKQDSGFRFGTIRTSVRERDKTTMKFEPDDPRRRTLIQMLAMGMFGGGSVASNLALAQILGSPPAKLPAGKNVYRISGDVEIDGSKGTLDSKIKGGSTIKTGPNSELVYVVAQSAYIARPNTEIVVETADENAFVSGLKLLTGKLLSVFPSCRPVNMTTRVASIGIRG